MLHFYPAASVASVPVWRCEKPYTGFGFRDSRMRWNAGFMAGGEEKCRKTESEKQNRSTIFWLEMFLFITSSVFFAGKIIYSAIPYHGALSWKIEEWQNKSRSVSNITIYLNLV